MIRESLFDSPPSPFIHRSATNIKIQAHRLAGNRNTSLSNSEPVQINARFVSDHWPVKCVQSYISPLPRTSLTPYTWAEKFESFERINSIRETNGNFDSCNSCKRLVPSSLHELHESKFLFVSRFEFIRLKLSIFSAHVYLVAIPNVSVRRHNDPDWGPAAGSAGLESKESSSEDRRAGLTRARTRSTRVQSPVT